jgi:quinoprotein glucose dehydrogenase
MSKIALVTVWLVAVSATSAHAQSTGPWQRYDTENGEWRSYAGNIAGQKYSPLDQIDADNFSQLTLAWEWESVDRTLSRTTPDGAEWRADLDTIVESLVADTPDLYRDGQSPNPSRFQATPLMIGGVLYFNTPLSQGVAVDAETGDTLWVFNPKSYEEGTPSMSGPWTQRGVAYWTDGEADERIFWGTGNGYIVCVQALTGEPCPDFGPDGNGMVDATVGIPRVDREARDYLNAMLYSINSPPIVVRDRVIHGSHIADVRVTKEAPPGWVRAWNVRTGEHEWDFHTVPNSADEFGADTWQNQSWRFSGNANVWSMLAGDNDLGHVYLPTGTTTNDYYGADRPGDNLFSESIIAVDVETGQRVWHFQAVHHGLWDYDFPTHPNLVDITVDGRNIRALAQVSKQGFTYVFDRATGDPVWPIEERPVPQETNLPGEVPSLTQPFPTKPPPFEYQGVTIDDLVDFTPEIRALAVDAVRDFTLGPLFTPPLHAGDGGGSAGTIQRPAIDGGANWGGAGVDPETGILYVPSHNRFSVLHFYTPDEAVGGTMQFTQGAFGGGRQPAMPQGLPLFKPPYSRMTAIDLNTGEIAWMQPNGDGNRLRNHPMLRDLDLPPLGGDGRGGPLVTKTLLISALSAGGSEGGPRLIARNKATGDIVGSVDLPSGAIGTPMTYILDGRQYIGLTIGGPRLIAFALPE